MTQKEAVARLMASNIGKWYKSYELVQKSVAGKFTGIEPMRRAYELVESGFTSKNASYTFESRRVGKYTEFRCKERKPLNETWGIIPSDAFCGPSLEAANEKYWNEI